MRSTDRSLRQRLERLASFRSVFRNPDFSIGQRSEALESEPDQLTMPYWSYSDDVQAFVALAYEDDWVRSDVNWSEWMGTDEAAALRDDPSAIERATPDQLAKLLTLVIRQERFVEGAIASAFDAGLIKRIVERAATIAGDAGGRGVARHAVRSIIGVDCATVPKNVGLARARLQKEGWRVAETRACSLEERPEILVAAWVEEDPSVLLALDAPLGWPAGFGSRLAVHLAGEEIKESPALFFNRATDRFVHERFKKKPLDVGADRIARTAHAALSFLAAVRRATGSEIPLGWRPDLEETPAVIEVYPAASLIGHGLPGKGFKGEGKDQGPVRRRIQSMLSEQFVAPLEFDAETMSEHELDAVLCVLGAVDFLAGIALPPEDLALAMQEGWIWAKGPPNAPG